MAHTGAMVALVPTVEDATRLAVDGGEEPSDLHLTMLYLGEAAMIPAEVRKSVIAVVRGWVNDLQSTVVGNVFAVDMFNPAAPDVTAAGFHPDQPRDWHGKWTDTPGDALAEVGVGSFFNKFGRLANGTWVTQTPNGWQKSSPDTLAWIEKMRGEGKLKLTKVSAPESPSVQKPGSTPSTSPTPSTSSSAQNYLTENAAWKSVSNALRSPLTPSERTHVANYGVGNNQINYALRSGKKLSGTDKETTDTLDAALAKSILKDPITVRRAVEREHADHLNVGDTYDDPTYISTSTHASDINTYAGEFLADPVQLIIRVPAGTHALAVSPHIPKEVMEEEGGEFSLHEVLLARDSKYRVVRRTAGVVELELVPSSSMTAAGDLVAGTHEPCVALGVSGDQLDNLHEVFHNVVNGAFSSAGIPMEPQHRPWVAHITLVYTDDADLSYFTDRVGPVTFDRVRIAFGDDVVDIPLGDTTAHDEVDDSEAIVVKFDPSQPRGTEGKWSRSAVGTVDDVLSALPDVKTYSKSQAGRDEWLTTGDIAKRSATLWAEMFGGQRAVRQAVENLRSGADPLGGVDLDDPQLSKIYSKKRSKTPYTRDDMGADVVRAASWIISEQDSAQLSGEVFRGMRVESPDNLKIGDRISGSAISWSPDARVATRYASDPHGPNGEWNARLKWKPVIVRGTGFHGADVDGNVVGRLAGQQPEIVTRDNFIIDSIEPYDQSKHGTLFVSYSNDNVPLVVTVRSDQS